MSTYNPPAFPRRPNRSNFLSETRYQLQLAYYRYEINTSLYVMSPGEKVAYNLMILSLLVMLATSVYFYFPATVRAGVQRLGYYFTGRIQQHKVGVDSMLVDMTVSIMESNGMRKAMELAANATGRSLPP
ncbi:hypothetical protein M433DRAFT_4982 [Acidomyces richmondensis BFW]|nr:MAG: hypothetical protein FE78DRAFT_32607 [Acidomyces sp. 'richmondensis']KYG44995.1 hypothetical protein M433DRAFT_4982 [Acidomyces richmondensis BFW]